MRFSRLGREWWGSAIPPNLSESATVEMVPLSAVAARVSPAAIPRKGGGAIPMGTNVDQTNDRAGSRRQELSHDIRHEVATIMLLASLIESAPDVGPDSRRRARQLLGEARWLDRLQRAYDTAFSDFEEQVRPSAEPVRLDSFASDVVATMRLSTSTAISLATEEAWARVDPLAFWRALRNIVGNGVRAAGPDGHVDVQIKSRADWLVAQVDDDGPGFGAMPPGLESIGLDILQKLVADWGGHLKIGRSALGGCRVRLLIPSERPSGPDAWVGERHAAADL